jgi:hypothetical protein
LCDARRLAAKNGSVVAQAEPEGLEDDVDHDRDLDPDGDRRLKLLNQAQTPVSRTEDVRRPRPRRREHRE